MTDLHWHPYLPPIDWLHLWQGADTWEQRDRDAAERVITAAELMTQPHCAEAVGHVLAGSPAEVQHCAVVAIYFLSASMAVCPDRDGLLADLASDASPARAEVLALADALADYLPDVDAVDMEKTGLYRQMRAISAADSAPLPAHLMAAVLLLGTIWRERAGTFDAFRAHYVRGAR